MRAGLQGRGDRMHGALSLPYCVVQSGSTVKIIYLYCGDHDSRGMRCEPKCSSPVAPLPRTYSFPSTLPPHILHWPVPERREAPSRSYMRIVDSVRTPQPGRAGTPARRGDEVCLPRVRPAVFPRGPPQPPPTPWRRTDRPPRGPGSSRHPSPPAGPKDVSHSR